MYAHNTCIFPVSLQDCEWSKDVCRVRFLREGISRTTQMTSSRGMKSLGLRIKRLAKAKIVLRSGPNGRSRLPGPLEDPHVGARRGGACPASHVRNGPRRFSQAEQMSQSSSSSNLSYRTYIVIVHTSLFHPSVEFGAHGIFSFRRFPEPFVLQ
jgi:hypothetical protein